MKNPFSTPLSKILFLVAAQCGVAHAATIYSHVNDGTAYRVGTAADPDAGGRGFFAHPGNPKELIVGGTSNANYSGISMFQLPDLNGNPITGASLTFTVVASGTLANGNADIYGLGYLASSNPTLNSLWQLTSDTESRTSSELGLGGGSPVKLVDNAVAKGESMTVGKTTVVTGASLVGFINSMYTSGAVAGDYVIFRVNPDTNEIGEQNFRYGNGVTGTTVAAKLDFTAVPEVSGMFLTAFGATGLMLRRRRD